MINFSTLQGLAIPEGVVTQITDASGRVLWMLQNDAPSEPIVLEVAKITSKTYASSKTYNDEVFILLSIYPKTGGTVSITYGGLTKTFTDGGFGLSKNIYFGTFNGVSDEVETPASGTLIIEGDCIGVGAGSYNTAKSTTTYCKCITGITEWGGITRVAPYMLYGCSSLTLSELPSGITRIDDAAFYGCTGITLTELPSGITNIGNYAFYNCDNFKVLELPSSLTAIGNYAFGLCYKNISSFSTISIPNGVTSIGSYAFNECANLYYITIPESVNEIGDRAFYFTSFYNNARKIKMLPHTPPTLGGDSVFGVAGRTSIVVPVGCGEAYKNAEYWSKYADYITEES